jgi:hypothetical protein
VNPVLSENLVAPGIEPGTSGSVAKNSDQYATEAVLYFSMVKKYAVIYSIFIYFIYLLGCKHVQI